MPGPRGVPSPALQGLRLGTSGTAGWAGVRTASTLQIDHLPHPHVSPRQALHSSPTTQTVTAHATRPSPLASSRQRDQLEVVPRAQLELPGHANDAPYTGPVTTAKAGLSIAQQARATGYRLLQYI